MTKTTDFTNFSTEYPNYFPGQYLLEDDFKLQHKYLSDRLRYQNQSLHVSGIIEGLEVEVSADKKYVLIKPGSAIDNQGNLIVLKENTTFSVFNNLNQGELYLQYSENKDVKQQDKVEDSYTRWKEIPILGFADTTPDNCVKLAEITRSEDSITSLNAEIREYSGLSLPNSNGQALTLRSGGNTNPNLAILTGSLKIEGDLEVSRNLKLQHGVAVNKFSDDGNLQGNSNSNKTIPTEMAIKTYADTKALLAGSSRQDFNAKNLTISESLSFDTSVRQKINLWQTNYGIGIQRNTQYFRTDKNFAWYKGGTHDNNELNPGGGTVQMVIKDGKVGIGMTNPSAPLQVQATNQTAPNQNGLYIFNPTNQANQNAILSLRVAGTNGGDPFVSWDIGGESGWSMGIDNSDGNKLKIARNWASLTPDTSMTLDRNGNVGIGTTNPQVPLEIHQKDVTLFRLWDDREESDNQYFDIVFDQQQNVRFVQEGNKVGLYLTPDGSLKLQNGVAVNNISNDDITLNENSNKTIPTEMAIKTYADNKAPLAGSSSQDFNANNLTISESLRFSESTSTKIKLWGEDYSIGIQDGTQYFRTDKNFAWYKGGTHHNDELNPGSGTVQMVINDGNVGIGTTNPQVPLEIHQKDVTLFRLWDDREESDNQFFDILFDQNKNVRFVQKGNKVVLYLTPDGSLKLEEGVAVNNISNDDITLNENSNKTIPTEMAIKTYADTKAPLAGSSSQDFNAKNLTISESLSFSQSTSTKIKLWGEDYSIGIQDGTQYFRTGKNFAWYKGGTHDNNELNSGSGTVQMVINDGKVGIGMTNPSAPLQVQATSQTAPNQNGLYIFNPTNEANQNAILSLRVAGTNGGNPFVSWDIAGDSGWSMGIDNSDENKLKIARNWASLTPDTSMTLDRNGNVGIGTTNPNAKLEVNGEIESQGIEVESLRDSHIEKDGAFYRYGGQVYITVDDNLYVRRKNSSNTDYIHFEIKATNRRILNLTANPSVVSDANLKKNIQPLANGLKKILGLRGITFQWKEEESSEQTNRQLGLIAQEVETIFPEIVHIGDEGIRSLNYVGLIAPMIEAIKEQQEQISSLLSQLEEQKMQLKNLSSKSSRVH